MSMAQAEILMALVILARSTSFMFSKIGMETMDPFQILGFRFFFACVILAVLFHRRVRAAFSRKMIVHSAILGTVLFIVMALEMIALQMTEIYMVAFLENTALVFVPFLLWAAGGSRPGRKILTGISFIVAGVAVLTLHGSFILAPGDLVALTGAFFYAIFIFLTGRMAPKEDALVLGTLQMGWLGLLSMGVSFWNGTLVLPQTAAGWECIAALTLLCSAFGFAYQSVAQKYLPADRAGLFCALDPLFATFWSVLFMGEILTSSSLIGALLVVSGICFVNMPRGLWRSWKEKILCRL